MPPERHGSIRKLMSSDLLSLNGSGSKKRSAEEKARKAEEEERAAYEAEDKAKAEAEAAAAAASTETKMGPEEGELDESEQAQEAADEASKEEAKDKEGRGGVGDRVKGEVDPHERDMNPHDDAGQYGELYNRIAKVPGKYLP